MLSATYSQAAISIEHDKTRRLLFEFEQSIQGNNSTDHTFSSVLNLNAAVKRFAEIEAYCHRRKFEMYVIPALRSATFKADAMLAECEASGTFRSTTLEDLQQRLSRCGEHDFVRINRLYRLLEACCSNLHGQLDQEEEELFPITQSCLSLDAWFDIATMFFFDDHENLVHKKLRDVSMPHGANRATTREQGHPFSS